MKYTATKEWQKLTVKKNSLLQVHRWNVYLKLGDEAPSDESDGLLIDGTVKFTEDYTVWVRSAVTGGLSVPFVIQN
ncbi:hypothetical protein [Providencia rettgeri]|uniref:hypothetical protein n=1 Tax=Providencia rettgeri TaxID=587 RepID=UPI002362635B|nr:hypothetical protein [Providencia rettgeri]